MTLRHNNGNGYSLGKISLLFGILASIAICVEAVNPAIDFVKHVASPWVALPNQVQAHEAILLSIQSDVKDIKKELHIVQHHLNPNAAPREQTVATNFDDGLVTSPNFPVLAGDSEQPNNGNNKGN